MKTITDLSRIKEPFPNAVVTLGNFDGVHLGHREIFHHVIDKAREADGTAIVFSFHPHPLKVLAPGRELKLLNTYDEKVRLVAASGIDVLICPIFTREFAAMRPEQFVHDILVERIGARRIVVGYDYRFGRGRQGDADFLEQLGCRLGFEVDVLSPISRDGVIYSSSRIREMIACGEVDQVVALLGRQYNLEGQVVHGDHRGRELGFPTANLVTEKEMLPAPGVYAVKARHGRRLYDAVVNIGRKPTFEGSTQTIEVHLLGFEGSLYGERLRIYFFRRLRPEKKFSGVDSLIEAIRQDVAHAREVLKNERVIGYREYLRRER
ncbi:MAG: bifunctional riboflavin kinase/FAD synthetase [Geoalkalibacter sp.]|jgi:riboflavin kinase/FMN adenylyltransferase|uniref:bifunctional riboflavin kinase/FAD synthetase n=1 Tax=Geoalkalibacter sp. TaxID=3041440 RepID=UPI003D0F60F0